MYDIKETSSWPKTQGIYGIKNKTTEKIYVGETKDSLGFRRRWGSHRNMLRGNRHDNTHLQNAYNLYGEDDFYFIVLEEIDSLKVENPNRFFIDVQDQWVIKLESSFPSKGYNTNPLKEYRRPGQNTKRTLPFFEFISPTGEIVSGQNIGGFARSLGLGPWGFRELQAGRKESYMGYISANPEHQPKPKTPKYRLLDPDGNLHCFDSMGKFAKEHGLLATGLSLVILGKAGHYKGWKLENPDPKFEAIIKKYENNLFVKMEDGKIHEFKNSSSLQKKYQVPWLSLLKFLNGGTVLRNKLIAKWSLPTEEELNTLEHVQDGISPDEFRARGGITTWNKTETNKSKKPVDCFDLDKNFIKSFPSISAAQQTISYQKVQEAVKKPFIRQAGGFYWKYSD